MGEIYNYLLSSSGLMSTNLMHMLCHAMIPLHGHFKGKGVAYKETKHRLFTKRCQHFHSTI